MADRLVLEDGDVGRPAADVDEDHADLLLVVVQDGVAGGERLEHDVVDVVAGLLDAAVDVLRRADQPGDDVDVASSRTPDIPMGSATPSCPSTMNSWGSTCRISRSAGIATWRVSSRSRVTSVLSISPPATVMTPRLWKLWMWSPAIPTITECVSNPAARSASEIARFTASTVLSMFTTTPRFSPSDGATPTPRTWIRSSSSALATTAQILVVPMSTPTTTRSPGWSGWVMVVGVRG